MTAERTPLTFVRFGPSQRFLRGLRPLVSVGHPPASRERGSSRLPAACPFMGTATFRLIGDGVNGMLELSLEWKKCVKSDKKTTIPDFVCHKIRDSRFYLFLTNRPIFSTTVWSPG